MRGEAYTYQLASTQGGRATVVATGFTGVLSIVIGVQAIRAA